MGRLAEAVKWWGRLTGTQEEKMLPGTFSVLPKPSPGNDFYYENLLNSNHNTEGTVGKLRCDFIVTNEANKETAGFFLGEMDLADVLDLEAKLLKFIASEAEAQKAKI